jgi:MFS family permease
MIRVEAGMYRIVSLQRRSGDVSALLPWTMFGWWTSTSPGASTYFTRDARHPATQVGLGLGIAGLVSLAVGVIAGHLADVRGPRGVDAITLILRGLGTAGFLLADTFWLFVLAVSVATAAHAAGQAARSPLIKHHGGERPQEFRAYLRAVANVGISLGALLAGWAVQADTHTAYQLLVVGNALVFLVAAAILMSVPSVVPASAPALAPTENQPPRQTALRDRPYLLLTALDGVMSIQYKVLTVAIPLWLVVATTAPRWMISGTMITNTVIVVLFQVRASRKVDSAAAGGHAYLQASLAFCASCALISLAAGAPTWAAVVLLISGVVIHTVGELWHAAGGFEVSFALAPDGATGQYLGLFGMGFGLSEAFGPALLIALCITWGRPGWYVVGAMFALTGLAVPAVVCWAERGAQREPSALGGSPAEALA